MKKSISLLLCGFLTLFFLISVPATESIVFLALAIITFPSEKKNSIFRKLIPQKTIRVILITAIVFALTAICAVPDTDTTPSPTDITNIQDSEKIITTDERDSGLEMVNDDETKDTNTEKITNKKIVSKSTNISKAEERSAPSIVNNNPVITDVSKTNTNSESDAEINIPITTPVAKNTELLTENTKQDAVDTEQPAIGSKHPEIDVEHPTEDITETSPMSSASGAADSSSTPSVDGMVYITPTGKKYHYIATCAGKNAIQRALNDVIATHQPCKKCVQ